MNIRELKKLIPGLRENVLLKHYTTFGIGGPARFFYEVKTEEELIKAVKIVRRMHIPLFILGGGSNLLISDGGFEGLVAKLEIKGLDLEPDGPMVNAGAGEALGKLIDFSMRNGLSGVEWAAGIPGTLGGAVRGNAAAFGSAMGDVVHSVRALGCSSFEVKEFTCEECEFYNKESIFKKNKGLIILSVKIMLEKGDREEIEHKMEEYKKYRAANHPVDFLSAGCIFKNQKSINGLPKADIQGSREARFFKIKNQRLLREFPELREFNKKGIIPAGYLIDKCGLKGEIRGGAKISEKHANFILNTGNARAEDVVWLIGLAKKKVREKFGVEIEEEIGHLGYFDY